MCRYFFSHEPGITFLSCCGSIGNRRWLWYDCENPFVVLPFLCLRANQRARDDGLNLCHSTAHQACCIANVSMPCRLVNILSADRQEIKIVNLVAQVFAASPRRAVKMAPAVYLGLRRSSVTRYLYAFAKTPQSCACTALPVVGL